MLDTCLDITYQKSTVSTYTVEARHSAWDEYDWGLYVTYLKNTQRWLLASGRSLNDIIVYTPSIKMFARYTNFTEALIRLKALDIPNDTLDEFIRRLEER